MTTDAQALILFSGLPGVGKSTISELLANRVGASLLSHDVVSAALNRAGKYDFGLPFETRRAASTEVILALADQQLAAGNAVIVDTLAESEAVRMRFRRVAVSRRASFLPIWCLCSDHCVHRSRLRERKKVLADWKDPGSELLDRVTPLFQAWSPEVTTLDAIDDVQQNLEKVTRALTAMRPPSDV